MQIIGRSVGRRARRRQRLRAEAGRGGLASPRSPSRGSPPRPACRPARSTSCPASARRPARRSPRIRASTISPSPARSRSAAWSRPRPRGNVVPVTLELGGKSPQLVFADADLDARAAAPRQRRHPERRPDLLGRLAHPRRSARVYDAVVAAHGRALRRAARRPGARRPRPRPADLGAPEGDRRGLPRPRRSDLRLAGRGRDRRRRARRRPLRRAARCSPTCPPTTPWRRRRSSARCRW